MQMQSSEHVLLTTKAAVISIRAS